MRPKARSFLLAAIAVLTALAALCSCSLFGRGDDGGTQTVVAPEHPISVTNVTPGKLLDFFSEVAIGSEYGETVDIVCKWTDKVKYCVLGDATDGDRELISRICERLNEIDGFPGVKEVSGEGSANLTVSFVPRDEIMKTFENADADCGGMAAYEWNSETGEIISARCAIDSALDSDRENTVCEEFLQSLGPANDSYLFSDSVFYQGFTLMPFPADVDFAVMEMLYSPRIPAGTPRLEAMSLAAQLLEW